MQMAEIVRDQLWHETCSSREPRRHSDPPLLCRRFSFHQAILLLRQAAEELVAALFGWVEPVAEAEQ